MNKLVPLVLLCVATSMPAFADPTPAPATQGQSADQKARLELLEKQKYILDGMQLPPVQKPSDAPSMLELPVDDSDSPGATKK
jgi:hypothetical protein